ncbi:MAG: hypothetical protein PHI37_00430 [Candidatus Gracilibacteria bacterium]|nr:hypothetical protein [Candidatus Gracilibacteria bacterium]
MQNFKIAVSKDGKKYTIVMKAENQAVVRERVHKEGYSILSLEEIFDKHETGNIFIFEGYKGGDIKYGKIVGNDIFKAYVKLKKDLEYDIKLIYPEKDEDISIEEKKKIKEELEEEYNLYYSGGKKEKIDELREKIKKEKEKNKNLDNFYLKKELEDVNFLLENVLKKLDKMISGNYTIKIDSVKKDKLKLIYNEIIKLKKTTNISKLREIGELALLKIGNIEIEDLEKNKNIESKELIKETNKLLRKIGSKDQFIEKNKDIVYQFNYYLNKFKSWRNDLKQKDKETIIDKESYTYIKTLLYLGKYKDYYKENTVNIIKNSFRLLYDGEMRENLFLTRSVIKQNIILLKARESGSTFSYTFIKKGINKIFEEILNFIENISNHLFFIIIIYTIIFLFLINFIGFINTDIKVYNGLFYFIIINLLYLIMHFSKKFIFLIINFVILFFIIIFGVINF